MKLKSSKKLLSVLLSLALMFSVFAVPTTVHAASDGAITSFTVDENGYAEVRGWVNTTTSNPKQVTLLILNFDIDANPNGALNGNTIMYIDQKGTGANGSYLFQFHIIEKFSQSKFCCYVGSDLEGYTKKTVSGTLRKIPSGIYQVADNAIKVGNDIYDMGAPEYTPNNIAKSLKAGGNKIYYKVGGEWYDMLSSKATNNAYFTKSNAIPIEIAEAWKITNYYTIGTRINFN